MFPNPIAVFLVPYGLYLVFYAWLSPSTIPSTIPLGTIAQYLGTNQRCLKKIGPVHNVVKLKNSCKK